MLKTADQTLKYAVLEMMTSVNLLYVAYVVRNRTISKLLGELRKLHNEELSDLYSLPNIVRVVK